MSQCTYHARNFDISTNCPGSLLDGGANGGVSGTDSCILETSDIVAILTGVGDSAVNNLPISTVAAKMRTKCGDYIIGTFCQYAIYGVGKTIHCPNQIHHLDIKSMMFHSSSLVVANALFFLMVRLFPSQSIMDAATCKLNILLMPTWITTPTLF